jgi:phytol kinase
MLALLAVFSVFVVLVFAEYLSRYKGVHSELTRKMVHILVGVFVAFWPFFLSWGRIQTLSLAFLVVVIVSVKLNIFRSIHAVQRNAMGEILFAAVIGILAFIVTDKWVFAAAMLHLSLADGLAAVVGVGWGESNSYKVLGHTKSVAGSVAFFICSVLIMIGYVAFSHATASTVTLLWLPVAATLAENVAIKGTDNIVIPLLVGLVLTSSL